MKQFSRQFKIIDPELLNKRILIIGAGGIGSWTTLALAKMGCKDITVMDFDTVDIENIGSQIYRREDVNKKKVTALKEIIGSMVSNPEDVDKPYEIRTIDAEWNPEMELKYEVIISALDSMDTRMELWKDIKDNPYVLYYIDGRMGGETMKIIYLPLVEATLELYQKYEKTLFPPEKVDNTPCTAKAICYNTFMIGSVIASMVKSICSNQPVPFDFCFDTASLRQI